MTTARPRTSLAVTARAGRASVTPDARLAGWADLLGRPAPEGRQSRLLARAGGVAGPVALLLYVAWRVRYTLPFGSPDLVLALVLLAFEAAPLIPLVARVGRLWSIDTVAPDPVTEPSPGLRPVVLITTRDEPEEVLTATVVAACRLRPVHQTWVLDEGARPWVAQLCARYGARHVSRGDAADGRSGTLNHALSLIGDEAADGREPPEVIAVLDADQVPLPTFLTATLGWFTEPRTALVQAPQCYYNAGAFDDDDGSSGEQGPLFHVALPAEQHQGMGPDWYGSTALLRTSALVAIGGVVPAPGAEELATTVALRRAGWLTRYHHQAIAVGMAPQTSDRYLREQRRRALGSVQLLVAERLWWRGRWQSWREYRHYLARTVGWLSALAVLVGYLVPVVVLLSGVTTSTKEPSELAVAFGSMLAVRLWGASLVFRLRLHWQTRAALSVLRVLVGLDCLWWLLTRRAALPPAPVVPGPGRVPGRVPRLLWVLVGLDAALLAYGLVGALGVLSWNLAGTSVFAPGLWLAVGMTVLVIAVRRIQDPAYATTRRVAYRVPVQAPVRVNGVWGELVDVSASGAAVRLPRGVLPASGAVQLRLPATAELSLQIVRIIPGEVLDEVSVRVTPGDWATYRELAIWLFHTPPGVVDGLPLGAPAVAAVSGFFGSRRPVLVREHSDPAAVRSLTSGSVS